MLGFLRSKPSEGGLGSTITMDKFFKYYTGVPEKPAPVPNFILKGILRNMNDCPPGHWDNFPATNLPERNPSYAEKVGDPPVDCDKTSERLVVGGALDATIDPEKTRHFFSESERTEFVALPGFGHVFGAKSSDDVISQAAPRIGNFLGYPPASKGKVGKAQVASDSTSVVEVVAP